MGTYQSIVNAIRAAAETVNPRGRFIHGRRVDGSQSYDGAYPLIMLYPFVNGRDESDNDTSNIIMGFWMQDAVDSLPEQREAIISQMDILSDHFETEIRDSIYSFTSWKKEPLYQYWNGTLSGYAISFNIITKSPC